MKKWKCFVTSLAFGLTLVACTPIHTTGGGAVGVERKQYALVSEAQVEQSATIAYAQETQKAAQKGALNTSRAETDRVRRIAARLIPETGAFRADAPGWKWEVNVIGSDELKPLQEVALVSIETSHGLPSRAAAGALAAGR